MHGNNVASFLVLPLSQIIAGLQGIMGNDYADSISDELHLEL